MVTVPLPPPQTSDLGTYSSGVTSGSDHWNWTHVQFASVWDASYWNAFLCPMHFSEFWVYVNTYLPLQSHLDDSQVRSPLLVSYQWWVSIAVRYVEEMWAENETRLAPNWWCSSCFCEVEKGNINKLTGSLCNGLSWAFNNWWEHQFVWSICTSTLGVLLILCTEDASFSPASCRNQTWRVFILKVYVMFLLLKMML